MNDRNEDIRRHCAKPDLFEAILAALERAHAAGLDSTKHLLDVSDGRVTDERTMDACGAGFRPFADLIQLSRIDVYGRISETVLERLHRKARMLGEGTVAVHDFHAGFARMQHERPESPSKSAG